VHPPPHETRIDDDSDPRDGDRCLGDICSEKDPALIALASKQPGERGWSHSGVNLVNLGRQGSGGERRSARSNLSATR